MDAGATFVEKGGPSVTTLRDVPAIMAGFVFMSRLNTHAALAAPLRESFLIGLKG
jgi:hypothetical protein